VNRLFVYGTLMPGEVNHHYLSSLEGVWFKASLNGKLYPNGIGKASGYPAVVLDVAAAVVNGFMLESQQLSTHWPILDAFEGEAYRRVKASIRLENTEVVDAYVYVLAEEASIG